MRQRILSPVVTRANELRAENGIPELPPVNPQSLRRTYISLLLEAGAPLPYVMRQVGHEDSRTTLEVYAQVQQRLSRSEVHQAFDDLLASAKEHTDVPTEGRENMSQPALAPGLAGAETGPARTTINRAVHGSGPRKPTRRSEV